MNTYICPTCGTQFPPTAVFPANCPICEDERQYVKPEGQKWTTLTAIQAEHHNTIRQVEPNLIGIRSEPRFAIGQSALLIQTPQGNILWDCISMLDEATITAVNDLGGIQAIAISHPHFYSSMIEWSHAFNNAPIYIHEDNRPWVMRPDDAVNFWTGDTYTLWDDITLIRAGGHFDGSTALHWPAGADGRGALFTGDTIYVVADNRYVSFMYSFPNLIPLSANKVTHITNAVAPYAFDRLYSGWWDAVVPHDAKTAVIRSAERYIKALQT